MLKKTIKKIKELYQSSAYFSIAIVIFFSLATFVSVQLLQHPLFNRARAQEVVIPEGMTALEYVQAINQSDVNNDGVINLFDYSHFVEEDLGKNEAFLASDINFDSTTNALDTSFMLNYFFTDVDKEREKVFASAQYAAEISKEVAARNEDQLDNSEMVESVLTITSDEGGSEQQFGRNIIPTVLGTVSAYTGSAAFDYPFEVPSGPGGFAPSVGLSYSSGSIDDARDNGSHAGKPFYIDKKAYTPFKFGYGFSLSGIGSIVRDTLKEKDAYKINDELYHRFILSLPGSTSAELKYNKNTGRWVSLPQAFLNIEHRPPGKAEINNLNVLDPYQWVITTKDGSKYYFGEENLGEKINDKARIIDSQDTLHKDGGKSIGTEGGNLYIEFDTTHICKGDSEKDPCSEREEDGKGLIVTKWLLRAVESSDGKVINYTYDTHQRKLDEEYKDTGILFTTASSYPKEITWNDNKHMGQRIKSGW